MMKNLIKKSRFYFYNLFLKISVLSILLIILLASFLYFNFRNFSLDVVNKSNEKLLMQLSANLQQINESAILFSSGLNLNKNATALMYGSNQDIYITMASTGDIEQQINVIPFIYSAYIFNGETNIFYRIGPDRMIREKDKFFDKELVDILDNYSTNPPSRPIARRIPITDLYAAPPVDVFTYITVGFFAGTRNVNNAIIVNVKLDWIYNSLVSAGRNTSENEESNIILINKEGLVVGHSLKSLFLKNISDKDYIKRILSSGKVSGSFVSDFEKTHSVITYVYIKSLNWYMLNVIPYEEIASSVIKVQNITLLIFLLLFILTLFLAFLISKQLYSPVHLLWHKTMQLLGKHQSLQDPAGEFASMETCVSTAAKRLSTLESFKSKNLFSLKEEALRDLLTNKLKDKKSDEILNELKIELEDSRAIQLVMLRIDNYSAFINSLNESNQSLYKFALSNIALEIFDSHCRCESVDMGNDHVVMIMNPDIANDDIEAFSNGLRPYLAEIQKFYKEFYAFSISAYISKMTYGIKEIHLLYKNVQNLSSYRIIYGSGCIITEDNISGMKTERIEILTGNIYILLDALKLGKADVVYINLHNIISSLYECEYNGIMFTLSYLSYSTFHTLGIIEKNSMMPLEIDFVSFNKHLSNLETLKDIEEEYKRLYNFVLEKINRLKEPNTDVLISKVAQYIETNYQDRNLCTDKLADVFNMTSPYLGKVFRERITVSISDYIMEVRLKKAKQLLECGFDTIDEILNKIGWENKKYFYTIFKKNHGITPLVYRQRALATSPTVR